MDNPLCVTNKDDLKIIFDTYQKQLEVINLAGGIVSAMCSGTSQLMMEAALVNWFDVLTRFVGSIWTVLKDGGTPEEVKAAVIAASLKFYDDAISPELSRILNRPLVFMVINPLIRSLVPSIVSGILDGLFKITKPADPSGGGTVIVPIQPTVPGGFVPY